MHYYQTPLLIPQLLNSQCPYLPARHPPPCPSPPARHPPPRPSPPVDLTAWPAAMPAHRHVYYNAPPTTETMHAHKRHCFRQCFGTSTAGCCKMQNATNNTCTTRGQLHHWTYTTVGPAKEIVNVIISLQPALTAVVAVLLIAAPAAAPARQISAAAAARQ